MTKTSTATSRAPIGKALTYIGIAALGAGMFWSGGASAQVCTQQSLATSNAASDGGYAWIVRGTFGKPIDNSSAPDGSTLQLFENGVKLGPAHALGDDIRSYGKGRYLHWAAVDGSGEAIRFAASDNTSPRTNGRRYTYCIPVADTAAPTVSLSAPAAGASVTAGAAVTLTATASDNVAVAGVRFRVDGVDVGAEDTSAPYSVSWNTQGVAAGTHSVTAIARDTSGNVRTSTAVAVAVKAATTQPASCTQAALSASTATNDGGYAWIVRGTFAKPIDNANAPTASTLQVFENGVPLGPPHSLLADISARGAGRFLHWSAVDGSGEAIRFSASDNSDPRTNGRRYTYCAGSSSGTGSATGDTTPPTVSIAAPSSGATVSGNVTLSASASDNVGIASVTFSVDGAVVGTRSAAPYSLSWSSGAVANGSHTLTVVARDAAGNVASAIATITVGNATTSTGKKTLLYAGINDWWLSETLSRWGGSGYAGFIIPGYLQWFSTTADLEADRPYATNLNQRGPAYGITDNFYSISITAQNFNDGSYLPAWQDDAGWSRVLANFVNIANFSRSTGMKGLVIDTENYSNYLMWKVADPRHAGLSKATLKSLAYQRGRALMQTLVTSHPGIVVMLLQEGILWAAQSDTNYELWPDFYNGMASVQAKPGIIIGVESSYPEDPWLSNLTSDPVGWVNRQASQVQGAMQSLATDLAYWQQNGSIAIGMRPLGVDYSNKSARYSPDVFKAQLGAAKAVSGPYVWVYSHGSAWWQMTQAEIDRYSNNPWHYTPDKPNQVLPTDINIQSYFGVVNGTR